MARLDAGEFERAISWNLTIAAEILGKEVTPRDEGGERYFTDTFHVCRQSGAWYDWASSIGGFSSAALIQHSKKLVGEEWSSEDATKWLVKFLAEHPGTGPLEAEDAQWTQTRQAATAGLARYCLEIREPLPEDGAEVRYLHSRGLPGPYPAALGRIPNARPGESALVMPLTANERVTGVLLTYIDALASKSPVLPNRVRYNLERAPGAVMEIAAATPGTTDISADVVVCEGLENGLSIARVKNPAWRIIALPGIAALKHLPSVLKPEERRIIIFQDSDPEGHPALEGLTRGVDALLLADKAVRVTEHSEHGDANSIRQTEGLGDKESRRLLAKPAGAALSYSGDLDRLAKLSPSEYEKARKEAAARHGKMRVGVLDREVAKRRPKDSEAEEGSAKSSIIVPVDLPWDGPVPQLAQLLDRITAGIRRYVVLKEWQAHLVAVWVALSYFVFDPRINLQVMARLAIQAATIASGKTTLLRIVCTLVRHGKIYGRATSAGIYRALSQAELTLCLDEVEYLRNDPYSPMMQVLDSSHHREDANILLTEPQKVGPPIARELSTWAAMALACNGQLPGSLQSRSIVVVLQKAMGSEEHEFLENRSTPELVGLRRELTAWAATIAELPLPPRSEMPAEVYNRACDNWRPMYAVARLAGDEWLDRIREASMQALKTETLPSDLTRLLSSIQLAFSKDEDPQSDTWLDTGELVARLIAQENEEWGTINRGRAVDAYWLRTHLLRLLDPPGAQEWWETLESGKRQHHRGYFYGQFTDAFRRYEQDVPGTFTPEPYILAGTPKPSGASGASGTTPKKSKKTADFSAPDAAPDGFCDPVQKKAKETAANEPLAPHAPDAPDRSAGVREEEIQASAAEDISRFLTQAEKRELREAGYSDEQIREAVSAIVHAIFEWGAAPTLPEPPPTASTTDPFAWAVERPSPTETPKAAENLDSEPSKKARPTARPKRAKSKKNGVDAESSPAPQLDLPEPPPVEYSAGAIAEEIRQIRAANPKRSIRWIAEQCGQPSSIVREILGDGEAAP